MEILTIILASSVISTIISFFVSKYLQDDNYKKEYYKEIIKKRLEAYTFVERQIGVLVPVVWDEKTQSVYHLMFAFQEESEDGYLDFQINLGLALSKGIWIDANTIVIMRKLNDLFVKIDREIRTTGNQINVATKYFQEIKSIKDELQDCTKLGIYDLHNIKGMFAPNRSFKKRVSDFVKSVATSVRVIFLTKSQQK